MLCFLEWTQLNLNEIVMYTNLYSLYTNDNNGETDFTSNGGFEMKIFQKCVILSFMSRQRVSSARTRKQQNIIFVVGLDCTINSII